MFIKSLTISSHGKKIRELNFRNGINLIVDETAAISGTETGNNVGKTTVLKLLDFCLGGDAKQIYVDPETKRTEYKLIKDFLMEQQVLVTLVLKADLGDEESREICIERNFLIYSRSVRRIDGVSFSNNDDFMARLTELIFPDHYLEKPTFKQIISHNIRYTDDSINNTLKTLNRYTADVEYETLYLFLFGCTFSDGHKKQVLVEKIKLELGFKKKLEENKTKHVYETLLAALDYEILELDRKKSTFNLNEHFERDLDSLNQVRFQIATLSSDIAKANIRHDLIIEAGDALENSRSGIDVRQLEMIYRQATEKVTGIQKTFDDLLNFHNRMVEEKVRYITKDLPKLKAQIESLRGNLGRLLAEERKLTESVAKGEAFSELAVLIAELTDKFRRKGELEKTISQLNAVDETILELEGNLSKIDDELFSEASEEAILGQLKIFNRHFSAISKELYGEQYFLTVEQVPNKKKQRFYKFSTFNANFGSGKKQGEISCFDIAYTLFADDEGIPCLHFLLNDKKELMHDNQLLKIAQLVNAKGIQFVASILKDKLPPELDKEEYFVVKLSAGDKLFRV